MPDAHKNFAQSTVATAPSPATTGVSLTIATGDGAKFPAAPFNLTVWPAFLQATSANAEIVRVTAITGDVLTIVRARESSTARSIIVGDQVAQNITAFTLEQYASPIDAFVGATSADYKTTGTSDDLVIQAAVNAVVASGGGTVYLDAGTYRITGPINMYSGVTLVGAGMGRTIIRYQTGTNTASNMMQIGNAARQSDITIQGITFDAQDQISKGLLNLNGITTNMSVLACELINMACAAASHWAIRTGVINDADIEGSASFNFQVHDCVFKNNDCGTFEVILLPNVRDSDISNNLFQGNSNAGTDEVSIYGQNVNFKYHHNIHRDWSDYAVGAKESDQVEICDNLFTVASGNASAIRFFNQVHGKVNNNTIVLDPVGSGSGVYLRDYNIGRDGHAQRNVNSFDVQVNGNVLVNTFYGISDITGTSSNFAYKYFEISRNTFYNSQKSPIRIGPNTGPVTMDIQYIFIRDNIIHSWTGIVEGAISFYGDTTDATKLKKIYIENNYVADNSGGGSNGAIRIVAATAEVIRGNHIVSTGGYGPISVANGGVINSAYNNFGYNGIIGYVQGNVTGATTFNRQNGSLITATLTGNITVTLTAGKMLNDELTLLLTQDATGSRIITWPANAKFGPAGAQVLQTAANAVDSISFVWDGTNWREKGRPPAPSGGAGDLSSNTATSVDSEIALFSSTTGKLVKRATTTGLLKAAAGVLSAAVLGTDYYGPGSAITKRIETLADAATVTINTDNADAGKLASLSQSTTFANPTATAPNNMRQYVLRVKSAAAQGLAWGTQFRGSVDIPLPSTTTGGGLTDYFGFQYNVEDTKWDLVALTKGFV